MKKSLWATLILVTFMIILGGVAWWYYGNQYVAESPVTTSVQPSKNLAATLAFQQGDVQVRAGTSGWGTVVTDSVMHQGDSIKTGEDSKAIIELENGDIIRLGFTTETELTSLKSDLVSINQVKGASYHRVVKDPSRMYLVMSDEITVQAVGTAFDVVETDTTVDVTVVESEVKVKAGDEEESVVEGKTAKYNKDGKDVSVDDLEKENLTNDWYTWNKEEDSKNDNKLGVLEEYAGPKLVITTPAVESFTSASSILIAGTVDDLNAKITINEVEVANDAGLFSHEFELVAGRNEIKIIAENSEGYRSVKELRVDYQTTSEATPLILKAVTEGDGVHLEWNGSTSASFASYKLVRSETNDNLNYPDVEPISTKEPGQESYIDTNVSAEKTYYYRVCEVLSGEIVFCSNAVHMQGKPAAEDEEETDEVTEDNSSKVGIFLTAVTDGDSVILEWEVEGITVVDGFKVLKSLNVNPEHPNRDGDDYKFLEDSANRRYAWALTDGKTYHFRVCQYNGEGGCTVYSNDVAITAPTISTQDIGLIMSAKAESTGVGIWWTDVSESVPGFKYFKVVRSKTNSDLRYPDDGNIAAKSADTLSHRDYSAKKGTSYYYRICAMGDNIYCSNVVQITATHENVVPSAVSFSGVYSEGSVTLSWGASTETDFKHFKVVWSQTDSTPTYPADTYIKIISIAEAGQYTDTGSEKRDTAVDLSTGTHYYSVCVVDSWDQVACSSVVTLIDGVVQ